MPHTSEPEVVITDQPYARPPGVFPAPTNLDFEREMKDPMANMENMENMESNR